MLARLLFFVVLSAAAVVPVAASSDDLSQLESRAEAGDPAAQYQLGRVYIEGNDVPRDTRRAEYWLKKSSAQCYAPAFDTLGQLSRVTDEETAAQYFRLAAAQRDPSGLYDWGMALFENRAFLQDASSDASVAGKCPILKIVSSAGSRPDKGETLFSSDPGVLQGEGVRNVHLAASLGASRAQLQLGSFYETGVKGVLAQDLTQAKFWYEKAAESGDKDAIKRLQELRAAKKTP